MEWRFAPCERPPIGRDFLAARFRPDRRVGMSVWVRSEPLGACLFTQSVLGLVPTAIGRYRCNASSGRPLSERLPHSAQHGEFAPIGNRG